MLTIFFLDLETSVTHTGEVNMMAWYRCRQSNHSIMECDILVSRNTDESWYLEQNECNRNRKTGSQPLFSWYYKVVTDYTKRDIVHRDLLMKCDCKKSSSPNYTLTPWASLPLQIQESVFSGPGGGIESYAFTPMNAHEVILVNCVSNLNTQFSLHRQGCSLDSFEVRH